MKPGITGASTHSGLLRLLWSLRAIAGAVSLLTFLSFPRAHFANQESSSPSLTVHEWGTFTSIAGKDGLAVDWLPLTGSTDLPSFVEHSKSADFKGGLRGTVRMETPVLYFYSSRETTVSVKVSFAKGLITEWYPHATSVSSSDPRTDFSLYQKRIRGSIAWNFVHIEPGSSADFPRDATQNRYYAAREAASAPLRVETPSGEQHERFLFYRGVSALTPPLSATLSADGTVLLRNAAVPQQITERLQKLGGLSFSSDIKRLAFDGLQPLRPPDQAILAAYPALQNADAHVSSKIQEADAQNSPEAISDVILFERRGDKIGYRMFGPLHNQASLAPPDLNGSLDSLFSDLEGMLITQGLFADEPHSMLETWKVSWFEEGSRLIYIVPRSFVDSVLPLSITPVPTQTIRVFVGRLELITPATEQAVESAVATGDHATLQKYSRFLEPILQSMIQQSSDRPRQRLYGGYLVALDRNQFSPP